MGRQEVVTRFEEIDPGRMLLHKIFDVEGGGKMVLWEEEDSGDRSVFLFNSESDLIFKVQRRRGRGRQEYAASPVSGGVKFGGGVVWEGVYKLPFPTAGDTTRCLRWLGLVRG